MQVQSCCFANLNLLLFCRFRYRRRRRCLISPKTKKDGNVINETLTVYSWDEN